MTGTEKAADDRMASVEDVEAMVKELMDQQIPPLLVATRWDATLFGMIQGFTAAADLVHDHLGDAGAEVEGKLRWLIRKTEAERHQEHGSDQPKTGT